MFDPVWLLLFLPLAAASGWYFAKRDTFSKRGPADFNLPSAYFKGLNFLLNEQPDKAIEVFIKVLEVDSETVEMHLTLGNLFRRRGEIERATRIHQNLIARPNLSKNQRIQALFELAQDYFKAGLFDRAENLFLELADIPAHSEYALRYLSQIYEQEKEWEKAISVLERSENETNNDHSKIIAQYYCEMADIALSKKDISSARKHIKNALKEDTQCIRATILLGEVEYREGNYSDAVTAWRKIESQDPQYVSEIVDKLTDAYGHLNDEAGLDSFMETCLEKLRNRRLLIAKIKYLQKKSGKKSVETFLSKWLLENPSLTGLRYLFELKHEDHERTTELDHIINQVLTRSDSMATEYLCHQCGFSGKSMHWHCPGCKGWTTVRPHDEEVFGLPRN